MRIHMCVGIDDDDCFYYHSWRNNVVILFGTPSSLHMCVGIDICTFFFAVSVTCTLQVLWALVHGRVCMLHRCVFTPTYTQSATHSLQVVHICVYVYKCVYACICIWMRMCVYDIA